MTPGILIVFGVVLVLVGLVMLRMKDLVWAWRERGLRAQGIRPERTPEWERGTDISGAVLMVLGLGLLIAGIVGLAR